MTIQQMIHQQMNHFIEKLIEKNQLTIENVIDVAAHTGAYLIRTRHQQNNGISNPEIEGVLQTLTDFLNTSFENQITNEELLMVKNNTLELLKSASFDQDIQSYFSQFYK